MSGSSPSPSLTTTDVLETIGLTTPPPPGATSIPDNSFLQPVVTPAPTPCHEVIIQLSTALVVKYDDFYPNTPIESFRPVYRALSDGSLISPPLDEEQRSANLSLLVIGALAAVFLRNIYASADYIHRGRVKKKTLFYLLLASQLLAPVSLTPIIVSFFTENVNCTVVVHISYLAAMTSLGILITGILGIKAYKCLENPKILLILLGLLQLAATAFVILDVIMTKGTRRLTGS
ncbi:hypothetical protein EST38_g1068 [Candolleomyces aberdarensis]|uniref:Uncharacterized protein n=1 Tax=Candolleomyces aberdarensis TaxID=2316362 RepID=A0A4Q2DX19_9AGAR|nr:hypothetical protein EST38_g1068 [Candolleomyces aberdarensis]